MLEESLNELSYLKSVYLERGDKESVNEIDIAIKVLENLEDSLDAKKERNRASLFDF